MIKGLVLGGLLAGIVAASALAAGPPPSSLKATVKVSGSSADVKIVNHSTKSFTGFFINSTDNPKISGVSDKSCKLGTSPWSAQGKKHVDYWADCKDSVAAGKTLDIKLTTSGHGSIFVWVKSGAHGLEYKIGTGGG
ncbi:MAG: hypothetical protein ACYDA3_03360 [Gaiellaceae bacterium]